MLRDSCSMMLMMSFAAGTFAAGASSNPRHLMLSYPSQGVPNNLLPLIIYPQVVPDDSEAEAIPGGEERPQDLASWFEKQFAAHGWPPAWREQIYPYTHYHPNTHELLGVASGWAEILFGGESGRMVTLYAGDAVLIPAGVGHQQIAASEDFLAVGAYPPGFKPRTLRDEPALLAKSQQEIAGVPLPKTDPISGGEGAVTQLWYPLACNI